MELMTREETNRKYREIFLGIEDPVEKKALIREFAKRDLFFLLVYICGRKDVDRDWIFDRVREVERNPNGYIDQWAREHYKSTIITFGLTIKDILNDPELTFCILSYNRPTSKAFLRQIKRELEENVKLQSLFPEIFYADPEKESKKWSEDDGLIVKRNGNPKESTIEAWGLVDSQPTAKHFKVLIYNDVVTKDSVTTPDMIRKVTGAWELSLNLGTEGGIKRYEGTRYHYNDTYKTILDRRAAIPRIYPATDNGTPTGKPVLLPIEELARKRREMGPYTFACQMLLDPKQESVEGFLEEWLRYWPARKWQNMNRYILCDPASKKKKDSDYTAFFVIGLGHDRNYYIITIVRDRMSLTEKANVLFSLHKQYRPILVGYEEYGLQADIEHYYDRMNRDNYRFSIKALGGKVDKLDRIKGTVPIWEQGRVWLPETCVRTNYEGMQEDLVKIFVQDEYLAFPFCATFDMLDCFSRIIDPKVGATFPQGEPAETFGFITEEKPIDADWDLFNIQ